MISRYGTQWLVLAVLTGALWSRLCCGEVTPPFTATPTVSPSPSPAWERGDSSSPDQVTSQVSDWNYYRAAVDIFYDSDKVVGIFPEFPGTGPNSFVEYQFPGEAVVRIEGQLSFGNATPLPIGTPIAFHCYSDWFGHLRGFERVRASPSPVYFVIPVSASALGVEPLMKNFVGLPPGGHGTGVGTAEDVLIGDSNSFPTAAVLAPSLPGMESRVPSVNAVYLPGNSSHETIGEETLYYPSGLFYGGAPWVLAWGYEENASPYVIFVPSPTSTVVRLCSL